MKKLDSEKVEEIPMCSSECSESSNQSTEHFIEIIKKREQERMKLIDEITAQSIQVQLEFDVDSINIYKPRIEPFSVSLDLETVIGTISRHEATVMLEKYFKDKEK